MHIRTKFHAISQFRDKAFHAQHQPWLPTHDVSDRSNTYMNKHEKRSKLLNIVSHKRYENHILWQSNGFVTCAWANYSTMTSKITLTNGKFPRLFRKFEISLTFPWPWISLTFPWPVATVKKSSNKCWMGMTINLILPPPLIIHAAPYVEQFLVLQNIILHPFLHTMFAWYVRFSEIWDNEMLGLNERI